MATRPETAKKLLLYWLDGMVALLGVFLAGLIAAAAAQGRLSAASAVTAVVSMAGVMLLYSLVLRDAYDERPRPTGKLIAGGVLTAATLALTLPMPSEANGSVETLAYIWLSTTVLYLPLWVVACTGAALVTVLTTYVSAVAGLPWQNILMMHVMSAVLLPGATWLWCWLWRTIKDANDSQAAKARLAVAEERLRFARDLHDLLGHSLSVITLKSELAAKLATKDAAKAGTEMAEVRRLAGESLIEVQVAVDGYRTLDLDVELNGVRAALEAAGARCLIDARADDLTPEARTLLAWVVREGATNVLKHSKATRCAITIAGGVLEMRNDGVRSGAPAGAGSGLRGLAERMVTAGGSFSAAPTADGEFLLRAGVPA
ncbi:sensor histidine kinase [Nonomuraea sp. SBT364]|uniref:sensor histidine kinase n=1 Tax=Nonomuraea sp. SBT364 TaxID=1580530 RepID=UPI00069E2E95|nr:histidine kinase [Nonomuraea sp. SBT364]